MKIENNPLIASSFGELTRASLGLTMVALGLCGFLYSAVATGLGQVIFPQQANGSLIQSADQVIGSRWVAQPFVQTQYFHPRPSASNYDPMAMAGSNMARNHPDLHQVLETRLNKIAVQEQMAKDQIPADLVTASASGIDPEIAVESAMIQVKRIAHARHLTEREVGKLVQEYTLQPTLGVLGQARVNVLELNLALDQMTK